MNRYDVDKWVEDNDTNDSFHLLDEKLPGMRAKLNRVDIRMRKVLSEIREVFPDAEYYTASGGFCLVLGPPHEDIHNCPPQRQREAWAGLARIGDGDW